jgi:anti-anti-sigma factor
MEDFKRIVIEDIIIEVVAIARATYKEAAEFKTILTNDIRRGSKKLIVDIRECEFIDSTFLGVLVFALKEIAKIEGDIRIVKSDSTVGILMEKVGTLKVFNVFDTVEDAVESFDLLNLGNHYLFSDDINKIH